MEQTEEEEAIEKDVCRKKNKTILATRKLPEEQKICGTIRRTKNSPVSNMRESKAEETQ